MWILEQCRKEWECQGRNYQYSEIVTKLNSEREFKSLIDPDHESFTCPVSMCDAIVTFCKKTDQPEPKTDEEFIRCIFDSLVLKYRVVIDMLRNISPHSIERLHIIGGGAMNDSLNQMTANCIGIPVIAGPVEATVTGNIMMQAKGIGVVQSLEDMRGIISYSTQTKTYIPEYTHPWDDAYKQYQTILNK